ncbi:GNAT family N-acetyltransferase [Bacillus bombysepticus]|uniref:GNAT family N-acetyltransferase n=1 Tax=Bacillus cereus TaxID=1396 RepID=A0A9X6XZY1_BACCE|nr:GNAT family N-acetyltransferase [Bacillus cereus]MEB9845250.1 GNAT family N-acetyltransferase [Bacillus cereus]PDZ99410.1 GNAT family N-acetyltransferase [Bacillus cereus]PEU64996.1 GNAT family N-acetyltransferase [Bacillus cereus]PEY32141.1 GNAT family N-acetyltransferase [Bacillus cereus]PFJ29697.1 GNAT family N-acetyltransferase [Bacillus cereus]
MVHNIIHNRFKLREIEENDWKDIHIYTSQSIVYRYQAWGHNSETETKEFVNLVLQDASKVLRSRFSFALVESEYERVVGAGAIMIRDFTNREGEIGYNIDPDYWGKGVATGVARLLITFGFEELNLHRIIMMSANADVRICTYMKQKVHRMWLHRLVK